MDESRAIAEKTWGIIFINIPSETKSAAITPAVAPKLDEMKRGIVSKLVSRIGLTRKMAMIKQPMPPPRVNHQAEKP